MLRSIDEPGGAVERLSFSPSGDILASGGKDGTIRLWRTPDARLLRLLGGHKYYIMALAFSADGNMLASGGTDTSVRVWSVADGRSLRVLKGYSGRIMVLAFNADGRILASADDAGTVILWRTSDWQPLQTIRCGCWILDIAFSPDSEVLAICSGSDLVPAASLHLWGVSDGIQLQILIHEYTDALSVAFSPRGKVLAAGCTDGTIRLFTPAPR